MLVVDTDMVRAHPNLMETMKNLIPKAIAYAKNVNAIENHSFQAWLQEKVEREDLIWWAQREENRPLVSDTDPPRWSWPSFGILP